MYNNNEVGGKTLENNTDNMKSTYFYIELGYIPYQNNIVKMIQRRILLGIAKGLHQSHGYGWKEVPKENKKQGEFKITIHGPRSECEVYMKKLENFGLNKVNNIMQNDENAIKRILPAKLRLKMNKGIHYDKENNAMQKIQDRLLGVGIVLEYGIEQD